MHKAPLHYLTAPRNKSSVTAIKPISRKDLKGWLKTQPNQVKDWIKSNGYEAENGEALRVSAASGKAATILWGLGDDGVPNDPWTFAALAECMKDGTYALPGNLGAERAYAAALGWGLASYSFDHYKSTPRNKNVKLVTPKGLDKKKLGAVLSGVFMVRDLVNTPANDMLPSDLAAAARKLGRAHNATTKVTIGDKLLTANFPSVHAVGRASSDAPRLIDMKWGKTSHPKLTLVGKGVCFDSGGLGIKPATGMRLMKKDMGGAAHALGLASIIMAMKLPVRLRVIIPAVENSISSNAFRPGDIIKTRSGQTVEIGHTDAEGRLILCDALSLACEENPDFVIDFATLTGAARVALGPDLPAMFTDDEDFAHQIQKQAQATQDPLWRLPLWPGYESDFGSDLADMNNMATHGFGGSIIAALFLKRFVKPDVPWAHFDIFAWNPASKPGRPKGGEAHLLRALTEFLQHKFSKH